MERIAVVLGRLKKRGEGRKSGFAQLFISKRLIHGFATAMLAVFAPIFLFEVSGGQVWFVTIFYIAVSLLYAGLLVPAMHVTNKVGFSRMLGISMLFAIVHYATLFFMDETNYLWLISFAALTLAGFRMFHWVPYHVNFAHLTSAGGRGKSVALMFAAIAFMSMLGPIVAGLIINAYGYEAMFGLSIILMMLAGMSYTLVPPVEDQFTWSFTETFKQLFSRSFRHTAYIELAYGAETVINLVMWPLFIYTVLEGNLLEVGGVTGLVVAFTIVVQIMVGRYIDKEKGSSFTALRRGSFFHALGWIMKMFVFSSLHVFIVGLYHNITKIFVATPYNTILYDATGDQGQYTDEFTVLREITHQVGRAGALMVVTVMTFFLPIEVTFIIGVLASLLLNLVARMT